MSKKILSLLLSILMAVSITACSSSSTSSVASTSSNSSSESSKTSSAVSSEETSKTESSSANTSSEGTSADVSNLNRNETLCVNIGQWGKANDMNPFSDNGNFFACSQTDTSNELIYETLYMYNPLDGIMYPLLADGDYSWNSDKTELTVKIKENAKWSDGTPVTADDVAYTFATHIKYQSSTGIVYSAYISDITAKDDKTVIIKANKDNYNPLKILEYLPRTYVVQKKYIQTIESKTSNDSGKMKTDTMWDAPHTGAYEILYNSDQKIVLQRDDNYWGQDASMWGKLPSPKYISQAIYSANNSADAALMNGEIDVSQGFTANVQKLWTEQNLPISTYYSEPPYNLSGTMPSAWFNVTKPGLDQKAVRQAIAYAVDYDQILTTAMTNQSPSFSTVPRSLFNPTKAEQDILANFEDDIKSLQWTGKEYDRANKVLDDAGIVDTDGDGIREYNGVNLKFKAECPKGWSDWNASLDLVSDCGKYIGIGIETYYPEATVWSEDIQTGNFDIAMNSCPAFSISNPWTRCYNFMYGYGGNFPERLTTNYGRYYNQKADEIIDKIPAETDEKALIEEYKELNQIYLEDVPSFALMYRPAYFYTVYEGVWTGFPEEGDGTNIPPLDLIFGYGVAGLYTIHTVK
jgi:peptide/nickel transport system substrate-binding protein